MEMEAIPRLVAGWEGKEWGVFWSSLWLSPSMALGIQEELNIC